MNTRPAPAQPVAKKNDEIGASSVLLVAADGETVGVTPLEEAMAAARTAELDLVEVAPLADPPVCRIMDYEKFRYEHEQKLKQARRNQKRVVVKEVRLTAKLGEHDYGWKLDQARGFLEHGAKVKVALLLRGRQREHEHAQRARELMLRFAGDVDELASIDTMPLLEGRSFTMVLAPRTKVAQRV